MNTSCPDAVSHMLGQVWPSPSLSARAGGLRDMTGAHPGSACATSAWLQRGLALWGSLLAFADGEGSSSPFFLLDEKRVAWSEPAPPSLSLGVAGSGST